MVVFAVVVVLFVHGGLFNESFLFVCEVVVCVGFVSCCCFGDGRGGRCNLSSIQAPWCQFL